MRNLGLEVFFAPDADIDRLWRLEFRRELGFIAARKEAPVQAKVLVLMSGLLKAPFENVLRISREGLREDGVIIGETVVRGLFEKPKWHEKIPIRYVFEFSMVRPTVLEITGRG